MPDDMGTRVDTWVDPDDVMAALLRAARRAHEIARDTGTKVVVVVDGKTVKMDPNPEMFDGLETGGPSS
ncbi:MAG: hypothetical protein F4139_12390 [Gemmatimonadetes bacterium]|nr:hypothetical protein [Gemmatimonadota bacterium]MYK65398.1 hypothetical protein [Gemmatimonadota bacterium]